MFVSPVEAAYLAKMREADLERALVQAQRLKEAGVCTPGATLRAGITRWFGRLLGAENAAPACCCTPACAACSNH